MHPESTVPIRPRRRRWGIGAAIVGLVIGAGVIGKSAVHRFVTMGIRAKTAEGPALLGEIRDAQLDHYRRHGAYVVVGATPARAPGASPTPFHSTHMDGWVRLGWQPESPVRCQYEVSVPQPDTFEAVARCDADGDGHLAVFTSTPNHPPERTSPRNRH